MSSLTQSGRLERLFRGYRTSAGAAVVVTGRLVARFRADAGLERIDSVARVEQLRIAQSPDGQGFHRYVFETTVRSRDAIDVANSLYRSRLVDYAEPEMVARAVEAGPPSDEYFPLQFHLQNSVQKNGIPVDIRAVAAWDYSLGAGVKVAVLDRAIECAHTEFSGRVLPGFDGLYGVSYNECAPQASEVNEAHGTMVAGVALGNHGAGKIAGVAPQAMLIPVRVLGGNITTIQMANAIHWAWHEGGADVLNNSWTWPEAASSNDIRNAILEASTGGRGGRGSLVIFAAGNEANPNPTFPATVPGAYSVSGVTSVASRKLLHIVFRSSGESSRRLRST